MAANGNEVMVGAPKNLCACAAAPSYLPLESSSCRSEIPLTRGPGAGVEMAGCA